MSDNQTPFRKKALETISSPEQLSDYLRVTAPGIWIILAAVILLLVGLLAWSLMGKLETLTPAKATVVEGTAVIVPEPATQRLAEGMTVRIGGSEFRISAAELDAEGKYTAYAPVDLQNGLYDASVVTETAAPIRFLFQ